MNRLCLQLLKPLLTSDCTDNTTATITLESFITLFVHQHLNTPESVCIDLVLREDDDRVPITISLTELKLQPIVDQESAWTTACELPVLYKSQEKVAFSGVCCICRQLIKLADKSFQPLLGFKGVSLNSTSESSVWTKFCEVDMIQVVKQVYDDSLTNTNREEWPVPEELSKFEMHLSMPAKAHNYYKVAREYALNQKLFGSKKSLPKTNDQLNILEHVYAESHLMTIADLILYANFYLISKIINLQVLSTHLPLTVKWYSNLNEQFVNTVNALEPNLQNNTTPLSIKTCLVKQVPKLSLYKTETNNQRDLSKKLTKQENVDVPLQKLSKLGLTFSSENPPDLELKFDWSKLPTDVHPDNGLLPNDRKLRKKQQLENLATEVLKIAKPGDVIVDFCCGTGHLGLLVACALPECKVILLDNKEESLTIRGREWSNRLGLKNVSFFQGNISYFNGEFDIGLCLHACGVATDIVLQKCMDKRTSFVCTPCCYGKIYETKTIKYPRSQVFNDAGLSLIDYVYLAHCADQAHDEKVKYFNEVKSEQGQQCMDIIDTDRKLRAEEIGYEVSLRRLIPETCTPKNRLLVGVISKQ